MAITACISIIVFFISFLGFCGFGSGAGGTSSRTEGAGWGTEVGGIGLEVGTGLGGAGEVDGFGGSTFGVELFSALRSIESFSIQASRLLI